MSTQHTPGPWHFSRTKMGLAYDIGASNGTNVALVHNSGEDYVGEIGKANARLIAAAPALLQACEFVLAQIEEKSYYECGDDWQAFKDTLKAAVAKARLRMKKES